MVPEFPSPVILAALFVVALSAVILAKRKFRGSPKEALLARIVDVKFSENGMARARMELNEHGISQLIN